MKFLWIDCTHPAPEGWVQVKTVEEAKTAFGDSKVFWASFDAQLEDGNGQTVLEWLDANGKWPSLKPTVHSDDAIKRLEMQAYIEKHGPYYPKIDVTKL